MMIRIDRNSTDDLISQVNESIRAGAESGDLPLSSESTFRFLFAWELGRTLKFAPECRFDFDWNAYSSLDSDDTFLDLLVYTDPSFKIALGTIRKAKKTPWLRSAQKPIPLKT